MRLASLVPSVPIEVVAHLEHSGFRTDADVLFTPAFDIFTALPPKTLSLQDVAELISRIEELASAAAVPANDLLLLDNLAREQDFDLSTGDPQLDAKFLGLGGRTVIEISGDRGSGKTAFALNVILSHLTCHPSATAAWIDTTGDFSPERAIQVLESYAAEAPLAALERLQVSLAFELEVARGILEELNQLGNLRYIVVDTVTSLLSPLLSAGSSQGHAMMSEFMCNLRTLSQSCGITVMVINSTTSIDPTGTAPRTGRKPALGPSFAFMTDATLWFSSQAGTAKESPDDATLHTVEIRKARSMASGSQHTFRLRNNIISSLPS